MTNAASPRSKEDERLVFLYDFVGSLGSFFALPSNLSVRNCRKKRGTKLGLKSYVLEVQRSRRKLE